MTVLKRETEPQGTFTEGYDAGLRDATEGKPRRHKSPQARHRNANSFRYGYGEGYNDGQARRHDSSSGT